MSSLWKSYFEEKGMIVVETDKGFMAAFTHSGICLVDNFYVKPEYRGTPVALRITMAVVNEAKNRGCKQFCAEIYKSDPLFDYILGLHKKFGMQVIDEDEFHVMTSKSLVEDK